MQISLSWLNEYIDIKKYSAEQIAETLTDLGLEVEKIEHQDNYDEKIVVGYVTHAQKHPNADTLRVCQVDVGSQEALQIVCGAHNVRKGLKVALAQKGSVLPDGMKIKASKIRGEKSQGMICSEYELGLSDDHDGILELPETHELGVCLSKYYDRSDAILELSLTPNRSDCLSYIGVARDLAAKLQLELKVPETKNVEAKIDEQVNIVVEQKDLCSRFASALVKGVKASKSPSWLCNRLQSAGLRPRNLIVDLTNYVMLETGHPLHAYDRSSVKDDTLKVLLLKEAQKFIETVDHPAAGILIDLMHLNRSGDDLPDLNNPIFPYVQGCDFWQSSANMTGLSYTEAALDSRCSLGEGEARTEDITKVCRSDKDVSLEIRSKSLRKRFPDPYLRAETIFNSCNRSDFSA